MERRDSFDCEIGGSDSYFSEIVNSPDLIAEPEIPIIENRQRFSTRLRRNIGMVTAVSLLGGGAAFLANDEPTAHAVTVASVSVPHHVYRTGGDGVWLHNSPGIHTQLEVVMPEGAEFDISCWQTGDTVNGDGIWLDGSYNGHQGSVTDYYIDDHWHTTTDFATQGIPECGTATTVSPAQSNPNVQPAAPVQPFVNFNRDAAKEWALAHAEDTPPDAGSCTWFVSQALVAGGFPQTDAWNIQASKLTRNGIRRGTLDAWETSDFVAYMRTLPYVKVEDIGRLSPGVNNLPDASPGDIIIYNWDGKGTADHADVVVGSSANNPQYPLVSGWSEDGSSALTYQSRGWTWSEVHNEWLQDEPKHEDMKAWLIHVRTEDEINVSTGN